MPARTSGSELNHYAKRAKDIAVCAVKSYKLFSNWAKNILPLSSIYLSLQQQSKTQNNMKRLRFSFLIALLFSTVSVNVMAYDAVVDGIYYNFNGDEAELTANEPEKDGYSHYSGDFVIPESVYYEGKTYRVTSIGEQAFLGSSLTSVTIPESVKSIGERAFLCSSLTSVTIPSGVTSIGENAFYYCISLTSVTINSNAIMSDAYSMYSSLSGVFGGLVQNFIIGEGVTSIGSYAFANCSVMTSVTIPESVTSLGVGAFQTCTGLTSVRLPGGITGIPESAFRQCHSLVSVTVPEGVTGIENRAFQECLSLSAVILPESVTEMGEDVFYSSNNVTVYGAKGSYAETYANENSIPFDTMKANGILDRALLIHIGANGGLWDQQLGDITRYANDNGIEVFWVTVTNDKSPSVYCNDGIRQVCASNENAHLIDWEVLSSGHRDWFVSDGIHMTASGAEAYSSYIYEAVHSFFEAEFEAGRQKVLEEYDDMIRTALPSA